MEPEIQKLATAALVGLLFLFPVFNQVAASSLEALKDADHKAKFKDFIKDWDDIPEDEKLSYWDGRNKPPGKQGDFDRDRIDDDADIHRPQSEPEPETDSDGDGTPDATDPEPDDPEINDETPATLKAAELWRWDGGTTSKTERGSLLNEAGVSYQSVDVTGDIVDFTGSLALDLRIGGDSVWTTEADTVGTGYGVNYDEEDISFSEPDVGTNEITLDFDYNPISEPATFSIVITGTYLEYDTE